MAITVSTTHTTSTAATNTTALAATITASSLVIVTMSFPDNNLNTADSGMSVSGTAMAWTKVTESAPADGSTKCRIFQYAALSNGAGSRTFTHTKGSSVATSRRMSISVIEGAAATIATAIPTGNRIAQTTNTTNVSQSITPAGSGSALLGAAADWSAANAYAALTNNSIGTPYHVAADYTTAFIVPTTNPLASGSAFTWGANCPGGANTWVVVEVVPAAGSGVSGTLATTEAQDAAAFTGAVSDDGALAVTGAADVAAFSGNTVTSGTLAVTEGADTAAFTGTVADLGTLAATETADAAAFTGNTVISGALAVTEAQDTAAFATSSDVSGTFAATEAADVAAIAGNAGTSGLLSTTETVDAAAFAGTFSDQGALAATEAADVASLAGAVSDQGTLAVTEAQDIAAFAGGDINGTLVATEARDTAALSGSVVNPTSLQQGGTYRPWRIKTKKEIREEELAELAEFLREVAKAKPLEIPKAQLQGPIQKPLLQSLPFYESPRIAAKSERYDDDEEALLLLIG